MEPETFPAHMRADALREHMRTHHAPYDDPEGVRAVSEHRYRKAVHEEDHAAEAEGVVIPHVHEAA